MFDKVLILSASAGAGHVRAAQALEQAFKLRGAARSVTHIDTLDFTSSMFRGIYSKGYLQMVNRAPEVLGWLYDSLDKPYRNENLRKALNKFNTRRFARMLRDEKPDIAVCTHFLPSEVISQLREKQKLDCPQAVVVTDLDVHAMWLCHRCEHYFVALDETRVHLEKLGVPAEQISVTGIPIDPVFAQPRDKAAARKHLGLDTDRFTILLSAGGFGVGPVEHLIGSLLEINRPAQVVAICGRNEELKAQLDEMATTVASAANVKLHVVGFTKEMDQYMAASDILVGKPGGLTTSEALARGLVLVIVNPIPGQEERNSDHLLEEGVAIRSNNLPALAFKLDRLLDDPARFQTMQTNVRRLARPNAATDIVDRLTTVRWR